MSGRLGSTQFGYFEPAEDGIRLTRYIYSHFESRWEFGSEGEPFPFEDTARYTLKRKRDRFTPEMLQEYMLALGIDAFNEGFYVATEEQPAYIFEQHYPPDVQVKEFSLEELRHP